MPVKDQPISHNDTTKPSGVVKDKMMKGKIMARFAIAGHAQLYADSLNRAVDRIRYEAVESDMVVK